MPHCVAVGCDAHSKSNEGGELTFHCFPSSDAKRRKQWEDACGRVKLLNYPRLCSRHFSPDSFEDFDRRQLMNELMGVRGYRRVLKPNAIPTIFPHKNATRPRISSVNRQQKQLWQETLESMLSNASACVLARAEETMDCVEPENHELVEAVVENKSIQCSPIKVDAATQTDFGLYQLDAAVQWPADAHYQVATDHSCYARKQELVVEDDYSQDLFKIMNSATFLSHSVVYLIRITLQVHQSPLKAHRAHNLQLIHLMKELVREFF